MTGLRIHATNLNGMGSRRLAESLLPELLDIAGKSSLLYLTQGSDLSELAKEKGARIISERRMLPNALSRLVEVTFAARRYRGAGSILVLGDIPLRGVPRQTVFVQSPFITDATASRGFVARIKTRIMQAVFAANAPSADSFIVQTENMKRGLMRRYGIAENRIQIIGQPPPAAILRVSDTVRDAHTAVGDRRLKLFYPSRFYPHKNHSLLDRKTLDLLCDDVSEIVLTVDPSVLQTSDHPLIRCIGEVGLDRVIQEYESADALLFLSRTESYGLPLLEALWLDMPIICPDLPYARDILPDNPYYFAVADGQSLSESVARLRRALSQNVRSDWTLRRESFPRTWHHAALQFIDAIR